jgi:hypothetical protein
MKLSESKRIVKSFTWQLKSAKYPHEFLATMASDFQKTFGRLPNWFFELDSDIQKPCLLAIGKMLASRWDTKSQHYKRFYDYRLQAMLNQ